MWTAPNNMTPEVVDAAVTPRTATAAKKETLAPTMGAGIDEYQMMKVRTMYNMVEEFEIEGKQLKVLFLTNSQADLLSSEESGMEKLLAALMLPKPKLVINLLLSLGFRQWTGGFPQWKTAGTHAGVVYNRAPFVDGATERRADEALDRFMMEAIIPLAVRTNAIILCEGTTECALSLSLTRVCAMMSAQWGHRPPFSIVSTTCQLGNLYCAEHINKKAFWRGVRDRCSAWKRNDEALRDLVLSSKAFTEDEVQKGEDGKVTKGEDGKPKKTGKTTFQYRSHDLDSNAMTYVIVDSVEKKSNAPGLERESARLLRSLC